MEDEQWNAIVRCDASYDGQFVYAVKTTGIFCRPSCKSRSPKRENVTVFMTPAAAVASGFRACKRCDPNHDRYPVDELAHTAMEYLNDHYRDPITLGVMAEIMHVNPYHLHRLFKRVVGMTPVEYLVDRRITEAKRLLTETQYSITDIAVSLGFGSGAYFSTVFSKRMSQSPSTYRNKPRRT